MNVGLPRRYVLYASLLTLVAGGWLSAAEYYVAQLHPLASDTNAGTADRPWKTLGKAVSVVSTGDTAWIKAGTYRENITSFAHSGEYYASALHTITVAAYSNDAVTLAGTRAIAQAEWQPAPGTSNVYYVGLADDPNQVFLDDARYPESTNVLTDAAVGQWYWDGAAARLYLNTGDGNPSLGHLVEPSVNRFAIDLQPRGDAPFGGIGVWNAAIRVRGLTFDRLRTGLEGCVRFGLIEDCVVRQAGGSAAIALSGSENIIRRNTVLNSLHQAICWSGDKFVVEDNLVVGALQDPGITTASDEGLIKGKASSYSTVRNNVVAEVPAGPLNDGGPGIGFDLYSEHNSIYGNVAYRLAACGIRVERNQNASSIMYNVLFDNGRGIAVRNNSFGFFQRNYIFSNQTYGIHFSDATRYPAMSGQRVEANWLVGNATGAGVDQTTVAGLNTVMLDQNTYAGTNLLAWAGTNYTALTALRSATGQEWHGGTGTVTATDIQLIKFRVSHSSTPAEYVPMIANPTLLRCPPSGITDYNARPYFWRQGDGSGLALGTGWSKPAGGVPAVIASSYPNLPRLWAEGGAYAGGVPPVLVGQDGLPLAVYSNRWGISVEGTETSMMLPAGEGWWTPSLPTLAGTTYQVSWNVMADNLVQIGGNSRSGPVMFVQWTGDTGQNKVRHYLWGLDDAGASHGSLPLSGSYAWSAAAGTVVAPAGATRVAFFFGLRQCGGTVRYRDLYISVTP